MFNSVSVCLCVCVCPLEAVDLSSTNRCSVTRVLPPSRPPQRPIASQAPHSSQSPLTPQLSHQQTSRPLPLLIIPHSPLIQTPILPSVVEQAAPKTSIIPQSVAPLSAGVSAPCSSPGSLRKLDLTGQRVGGDDGVILRSPAPGRNTSFTEDEGDGKIVPPTPTVVSVSERTTHLLEADAQPMSIGPDDLSVKSK